MRRLLVLLPDQTGDEGRRHALRLADAARRSGLETAVAPLKPVHWRPGENRRPALPDHPRPGPGDAERRAEAEAARAAFSAAAPDAVLLPVTSPLLRHGAGAMQALSEARIPALVIAQASLAEAESPAGLEPEILDVARAMRAEWSAGSAASARRAERLFGLPAGRVSVILNGVDRPTPANRAAARAALRGAIGVGPGVPVALFEGGLDAAAGADRLPGLALEFARRSGGVIACGGTGVLEAAILAAAPGDHPLRPLPPGTGGVAALAGSDLLILPSRLGDLPDRFLEAAFLRVPVVAGTQALQALGEGAALFASLVDAGNLRDMAEAMAACLDPGDLARAKLENAWRIAGSWDAAAMAGRHLALLRRLAAPPLGSPGAR